MGHASIKVTADTYGHLIPGADINWIDRLDREVSPQPNLWKLLINMVSAVGIEPTTY